MSDVNDLMQQMMTGYGVSAPSPDELDRIIKEDEEKKARIAAEKKRAEDEARAAEERARIAAERQAAAERARQEAAERRAQQRREEQARIEMERLAQEEKKRLAAEKDAGLKDKKIERTGNQPKSNILSKVEPTSKKADVKFAKKKPVYSESDKNRNPIEPKSKVRRDSLPVIKRTNVKPSPPIKSDEVLQQSHIINPHTAQGHYFLKRMVKWLEDSGE